MGLASESILEREENIFHAVESYSGNIPVVYCLPGGYEGYNTSESVQMAVKVVKKLQPYFTQPDTVEVVTSGLADEKRVSAPTSITKPVLPNPDEDDIKEE